MEDSHSVNVAVPGESAERSSGLLCSAVNGASLLLVVDVSEFRNTLPVFKVEVIGVLFRSFGISSKLGLNAAFGV